VLVVLADELDQDVERAGAHDDVLQLGKTRELFRDLPHVAVDANADERLASEADRDGIGHRDDLHHVLVEETTDALAHRRLGQPDGLGEVGKRASTISLELFHDLLRYLVEDECTRWRYPTTRSDSAVGSRHQLAEPFPAPVAASVRSTQILAFEVAIVNGIRRE